MRLPSDRCTNITSFTKTSELWITMVSTGATSSSQLRTHLPPGTSQNGLNITVVAHVSDNLGACAVTSLDVDGIPLAFVSTLPDQVRYHSRHFRNRENHLIEPGPQNARF